MWFEIYIRALWQVMLDLSPSLLLGLLIAGLMRVYLPKGLVHRGLNRSDMRSAATARAAFRALDCGVSAAPPGHR